MENEYTEEQNSLNSDEIQDSIPESEDDGYDEAEAKIKKAEEIALNQKIRAEKAEKELKALKNTPKEKETPTNITKDIKDLRALQDIEDDEAVEELVSFAEFKKIPIHEAKRHPVMQNYLKVHAEEKATAEATSMNTGRGRVNSQTSDQTLIDQVNQGTIRDEDIEKAAQARLRMKKALNQ